MNALDFGKVLMGLVCGWLVAFPGMVLFFKVVYWVADLLINRKEMDADFEITVKF